MKNVTKEQITIVGKCASLLGAIAIMFLVLGSNPLRAQTPTTWGYATGTTGAGWTLANPSLGNVTVSGAGAPSDEMDLRGDFPSPVILTVGQRLTVFGTMTTSGTGNFPSSDFRLGLFNNKGAGGTVSSSVWTGGTDNSFSGYLVQVSTGGNAISWNGGGTGSIGLLTTGKSNSWISSTGDFGIGGPTSVAANAQPGTYSFSITATLVDATHMQIDVLVKQLSGSGSYTLTASATDDGTHNGAALSTSTFTSVGFRVSAATSFTSLAFTNVRAAVTKVYNNPTAPVMGTAANFRALAGTALSIAAGDTVNGNVGGLSVANLGFVTGTTDVANGNVTAGHTDLSGAIADINGRAADSLFTAVPLDGLIFGRGVYVGNGTLSLTGTLTLYGTATDTIIFRTGSPGTTILTTDNNSTVSLVGGILASNIYWLSGSTTTLGSNTIFNGNILAGTTITQGTGASVVGRVLSLTDVTLNGHLVLPVELVSFTGTANRTNANLHWSTATEARNYGFDIERRQTGEWTKVGFVAGAGSSSSPRDYSFSDKNLSVGRYTYRLKQIDNSGTFSYHGLVEIEIASVPQAFALLQNYPNPFNPSTKIQYNLAKAGQVSLRVYNLLGSEVATLVNDRQEAGSYAVSFNSKVGTLGLASGVYIYRLQAGSSVSTKKLVIMK